jgi:cytochrome P450
VDDPYDLFSQAFLADPFPTLRRMREEHPVYFHPLLNAWVLTRYDDIQAVLHDRRFSNERSEQLANGAPPHMQGELAVCDRFFSLWMVFRDPPRHTLLRALVSKAMTAKTIEGARPFVEETVARALDAAVAVGRMDLVKDLAEPLPALTIARLLGVPSADVGTFKAMTADVFSHIGAAVATEEVIARSHRGATGLLAYFRGLIDARRKAPGEDLLSRLVHAEEQGAALDEEELTATCAMLLAAGHETTTHLIGNAVLALLRSPAELDALRADAALYPSAIEEILRYDGAVLTVGRRALEDVEIGGERVAAGQYLFCHLHGGNHDPARYADPDRLDVRRKDVRQLDFGQGIHHCIGAPLARLEAQIALRQVVERLPDLRLPPASLSWIPSIVVHGLTSLPVAFG